MNRVWTTYQGIPHPARRLVSISARPWSVPLCLLAAFLFALAPLFGQTTPVPARYYFAIENIAAMRVVVRHATTKDQLPREDIILASKTRYREWLYWMEPKLVGFGEFATPPDGQRFVIPKVSHGKCQFPDSDDDGLPEDAEFVIGTNPRNPDTDDDGIRGGEAIKLGLDPRSAFWTSRGEMGPYLSNLCEHVCDEARVHENYASSRVRRSQSEVQALNLPPRKSVVTTHLPRQRLATLTVSTPSGWSINSTWHCGNSPCLLRMVAGMVSGKLPVAFKHTLLSDQTHAVSSTHTNPDSFVQTRRSLTA